jgi:hypothetical protein
VAITNVLRHIYGLPYPNNTSGLDSWLSRLEFGTTAEKCLEPGLSA